MAKISAVGFECAEPALCPTAAFPVGGEEKSSGRADGVRIPETKS
jgi:hypothetical protein